MNAYQAEKGFLPDDFPRKDGMKPVVTDKHPLH